MSKKLMGLLLILIFIITLSTGCADKNDSIEGNQIGSGSQSESNNKDTVIVKDFTKFKTTDINGEEVTEEVFQDYKLTMINVWGTFCGPCIDEMPSLGELQKEYKNKGVNIIGIVVDVQDSDLNIVEGQVEMAKEIITLTGADYTHLIVSPELITAKIGQIDAIPASFFVDKEGNFVGETYLGSRSKKKWVDIIEKELENLQN